MLDFKIDEERCIACGECVKDCPYMVLEMDGETPRVAEGRAEQCVRCQHCLAVCPTAALSILGVDPDDCTPLKGNLPSKDQMETLISGRRSVRRYSEKPVDREVIDRMLEVVGDCPTGVNTRGTLYTVIDDPEVMQAIREETMVGIRAAIDDGNLPEGMEFFEGFADLYEGKGVDVIFRGAPHFLVVSAPTSNPSPEADCLIALTNFELLAASMGLGTVWNGLAKWALTMIVPGMREKLGIPADHVIGYMMAFGKPAVKYHRTVKRGATQINRVAL